jgi:glycerol kinase
MNTPHILAIDQGTTSTRAIVFGAGLEPVASAQQEIEQLFPQPGWVEHNPEEIWRSVISTSERALASAGLRPAEIGGIGITNQRETIVVWSKETGIPLYNAIVWQDHRTAEMCKRMKGEGLEQTIIEKTGLLLDPYFSGTKVA